jgi:galactonate dehydratase
MPKAILLQAAGLAGQASPARSRPPSDIIREARWVRVREPVSGRSYSVLRLATASGLVGYGECGPADDSEMRRILEAVIDQDPSAYEVIRGRVAPLTNARAAVNIALLDILGQRARAPVYQILGGPTRNKVRALAPLEGATDDELKRRAEEALRAGYKALSVPPPDVRARDSAQAFVLAVRKRLEELRAATGPGVDFVLDGGAALTPADASAVAAALERFHLLWLDEPCSPLNQRVLRKISAETVTPVGYGRTIDRGAEFQDLLREGLVDVLRPDIHRHGISVIRQVAALAETYYVAVAPFHSGGPIATAAALHLAASLPNFFIQQIPLPADPKDRAMRAAITSGAVETPREGFVPLLTGPGLGIRVDEEALKRYAAS